jgi:hypothetical protein
MMLSALDFIMSNARSIERKAVCGQLCRVGALHLEQPEQALHALASPRAQRHANRLAAHADAPREARDADEIAVTVVPDVGDRATGSRRLDARFERRLGAQCFDRGIDTVAGQLHDLGCGIHLV